MKLRYKFMLVENKISLIFDTGTSNLMWSSLIPEHITIEFLMFIYFTNSYMFNIIKFHTPRTPNFI